MYLSIIIPLYNEEESLYELYKTIIRHLQSDLSYEIIFIDDGSKDASLKILKEIKRKDECVRIIHFHKNYGKAAALATGFKLAKGEYVVTMDADLQDDPAEIPRFLTMIEEKELDLISGWKKLRHDPLEKKIPSKFFNWITSLVGGIKLHDFNCGFKCYRQKTVKALYNLIHGNIHRYIPLLAYWAGFRVGEMVVNHHPRKYGKSKYGFLRYFHGFVDLVTLFFLHHFRVRSMYIFMYLGLLAFLSGATIESYFFIQWCLTKTLHVRPILLMGLILIVVGLQFFSLGLISEMILQKSSKKLMYHYTELP